MKQSEQQIINDVMDYFDFSKAAKVMYFLDWVWANTDGCVPTEGEIRSSVRKRLNKAVNDSVGQKEYSVSSGGFECHVFREDNLVVWIDLKFVVEDCGMGIE